MSKEMWVIVLGLWTIVLPYLGIPGSWKVALFVLTGLAVATFGFLLRGEALSRSGTQTPSRPAAPQTPARNEIQGISSLN